MEGGLTGVIEYGAGKEKPCLVDYVLMKGGGVVWKIAGIGVSLPRRDEVVLAPGHRVSTRHIVSGCYEEQPCGRAENNPAKGE